VRHFSQPFNNLWSRQTLIVLIDTMAPRAVSVFYGSQTGCAESIAQVRSSFPNPPYVHPQLTTISTCSESTTKRWRDNWTRSCTHSTSSRRLGLALRQWIVSFPYIVLQVELTVCARLVTEQGGDARRPLCGDRVLHDGQRRPARQLRQVLALREAPLAARGFAGQAALHGAGARRHQL